MKRNLSNLNAQHIDALIRRAASRRGWTAPVEPPVPSGIRTVVHGRDNHAGHCNFCDRYITATGATPHEVLELSGVGLLARVCRACARELLPSLVRFAEGKGGAKR